VTTVTGSQDGTTNIFDSSQLLGLAAGTLGAHDSTQFVLTAYPFTVTVYGSGFTYSGNHPVTGTMTSLTILLPTYYMSPQTWSGFSLAAATVWSAIATGNVASFNSLFFGGNDTFNMLTSLNPDFLIGGAGNDTFNYLGNFNGATQIDGGSGTDTINFDGDYSHYGLTLGGLTSIEVIHLAGGHSYQGAMGPSTATTLDGSALGANDFLDMNAQSATGAITVTSGGGNDKFVSGHGNDTFNAGAGSDTIDYSFASSGVNVNLSIAGPQAVGGGEGTDTLVSVENIIGSGYNDTLIGNADDNLFDVSYGNDAVNGGGGNDTASFTNNLNGPVTVDLRTVPYVSIENILGSRWGGDVFIGDANDNVFDGNVRYFADPGPIRFDTASYQYATGGITLTQTGATMFVTGGGQGTDTLLRVAKVIGSNYDDTFSSPDVQFLDGGGGYDTANFQTATAGVSAGLQYNWTNIEKIIGSNFNDSFGGSMGADYIDGGAGDDQFRGYGSIPYGGPYVDGNDTIFGGPGNDTMNYSAEVFNYTITFNADQSITVSGAVDGTDTLWSVESLAFFNNYTLTRATAKPTRTDFNADHDADILWQNTDGTAAIWLMNGKTFAGGSGVGDNPGTAWQIKGSGDFNGDGYADILWQSIDGTPVVWFMSGTTFLGGGVLGFNPGSAWHLISSGDFNQDGHADLLWQNTDGTPAIWLMNGTTFLSGAALVNPGTSWHVIGAADFDGYGKSDILWQNTDGTAAVWLMDGTSIISGSVIDSSPGTAWHVKAAGDFNGDGTADILWQNDDGTPDIWFLSRVFFPAISFGGSQVAGFNPGSAWHVIGASDFSGDGRADILWQNADGTPAVWVMNGATLLSGAALPNPSTAWHIMASTA